jgi:hypothetical protein
MAERARFALAAALGALCLWACADEARKRESELTQLLEWLPGSYESSGQGAAGPGSQVLRGPQRIALVIVRVYTPRLGRHVLYAQESAADDPRRVMSERLFAFGVDEKRGIVENVYTFAEPLRWRNGHEHPELFTSVVAEDVRTVPGCDLVWTKAGEQFSAVQDPKQCHDAAAAAGEAPAAELTADTLLLGGYRFRKAR